MSESKPLDLTLHANPAPNDAKRVSWITTVGYGSGDFGFNLYFAGLNLYLLYYYTDILNIDPAVAGLIIMLPVIWDGISDPLMGWIVTRTRSRFGKFRTLYFVWRPVYGAQFCWHVCRAHLVPRSCGSRLSGYAYDLQNSLYRGLSALLFTGRGLNPR